MHDIGLFPGDEALHHIVDAPVPVLARSVQAISDGHVIVGYDLTPGVSIDAPSGMRGRQNRDIMAHPGHFLV
jgi:hypothetical protein